MNCGVVVQARELDGCNRSLEGGLEKQLSIHAHCALAVLAKGLEIHIRSAHRETVKALGMRIDEVVVMAP